jgi:hypothetical protein
MGSRTQLSETTCADMIAREPSEVLMVKLGKQYGAESGGSRCPGQNQSASVPPSRTSAALASGAAIPALPEHPDMTSIATANGIQYTQRRYHSFWLIHQRRTARVPNRLRLSNALPFSSKPAAEPAAQFYTEVPAAGLPAATAGWAADSPFTDLHAGNGGSDSLLAGGVLCRPDRSPILDKPATSFKDRHSLERFQAVDVVQIARMDSRSTVVPVKVDGSLGLSRIGVCPSDLSDHGLQVSSQGLGRRIDVDTQGVETFWL